MWRSRHACRLVGGPFDGDEGRLDDPLPEEVWAYACPDPECNEGGVHWMVREVEEIEGGERYRRGKRRNGVQLYVHAGLELDPSPGLVTRELVPA